MTGIKSLLPVPCAQEMRSPEKSRGACVVLLPAGWWGSPWPGSSGQGFLLNSKLSVDASEVRRRPVFSLGSCACGAVATVPLWSPCHRGHHATAPCFSGAGTGRTWGGRLPSKKGARSGQLRSPARQSSRTAGVCFHGARRPARVCPLL